MRAWTQMISAWLDGSGVWQPEGSDQAVAASGFSLAMAVATATVPGWTGVRTGNPALVLSGVGVGISAGQAVSAGTIVMALAAQPATFQDAAWRERRVGHSVAAVSWRAASRPTTGAVLASSLGLPMKTA